MACAPSAANAVAIARPMLLVAPVTSAVLFLSRVLNWVPFVVVAPSRCAGQRVLTKATTVSAPAAAMAPATSSIASTPCTYATANGLPAAAPAGGGGVGGDPHTAAPA